MFTVTLARAVLSPWPVCLSPAQVSSLSLLSLLACGWSSLCCWPGQAGPHPLGWDWPAELTARSQPRLQTNQEHVQCAGGWLVPRVGGDVCGAGDARVEDKSKLNLIHGDIIRKTVFSKDSKRIACSCQRYTLF